jgi:hypothetical protein
VVPEDKYKKACARCAHRRLTASAPYEYVLGRSRRKGLPKGYLKIRPAKGILNKIRYRHGIVQYAKPLSTQGIATHKLYPISKHDPWVHDKVIDLLYLDLIIGLKDHDVYYFEGKNGPIEIGRMEDGTRRWYAQLAGKPSSPIFYASNLNAVCEHVWNKMMGPNEREPYLDVFDIGA